MYICMGNMYGQQRIMAHMWKSEGTWGGLPLPGLWDQTQVIGLGNKPFYPLIHPAGPQTFVFF